ncbi:MAG: hypothetical protein R6X05_17925 [Desulfobacterales bacterium]
MPAAAEHPSMNQKIFALGLPVETVSLYLLCCALADQGTVISEANLQKVWTDSPQRLTRSLAELTARKIIEALAADAFRVNPPDRWQD